MQETSVRDIKPRGSPRRVVVRIARSGENRNRDNHLYEIGFMFVDHLVHLPHQHLLSIFFLFPAHEAYALSKRLRFSYLPTYICLSIIIPLTGL
jgi:hypothetical protein